MKFNKNDKVRVINTGDVWEGKIGLVYEEQEDEIITTDGQDLTQVDVLITINTEDGEKQVMKNFDRENLEAVAEESLTETVITEDNNEEPTVYPQTDSVGDFKSFFIGKKGIFKGFDYEELYSTIELDDGTFDFREEDKEEINLYKSLEGQECTIVGCAIAEWDTWTFTEILYHYSRWDIEFEDGTTLNAIPGYAIKLNNIASECLTEALDDAAIIRRNADKTHKENDIIAPFVYKDYGDEELIPSWSLIGPIENYYGIDEETIYRFCKEYGHKMWCIRGAVFSPRIIVAAKEITSDDLLDGYANYLDGYRSATVEEIEL